MTRQVAHLRGNKGQGFLLSPSLERLTIPFTEGYPVDYVPEESTRGDHW
jgi:hypothetical protein